MGINKVRVRLHRCGGNVRSKDDSDEVDQKMLVWMMTTMRSIKRSVRSKDDKGRVTLPKRMNFWKSSKGGEGSGGGRFNPKIYVADFGPLNRAFSRMTMRLIKDQFDQNIMRRRMRKACGS